MHSTKSCKLDNTAALSGKIYLDYRFLREEGCSFTFISTETLPIQKKNTLKVIFTHCGECLRTWLQAGEKNETIMLKETLMLTEYFKYFPRALDLHNLLLQLWQLRCQWTSMNCT